MRLSNGLDYLRAARNSGLGAAPQKGGSSSLSTLLKTTKMFARGTGEIFPEDAWRRLLSNSVIEPAAPVTTSMPC